MKRYIILILSFLSAWTANAQDKAKNTSLNGYLQTMEMVWMPPSTSKWFTMNTISNRLDFRWYPSEHFETYVAMRNIASYGQIPFEFYPFMADLSVKDNGKSKLRSFIMNILHIS